MTTQLGELRRLTPREVWPDEARNFTPWLAENLQDLGEALGMDIELTTQEAGVGRFSCDLLAKDLTTGRVVVIENQYGSTDHDHLGKLLTYAAGLDGRVVIWVTETLREEHRQALEWLNTHTDVETEFFVVVIEVLQIDTSRPAVNFKPVVFPNDWQREAKRRGGTVSDGKGEAYRAFFQTLIDELRDQHRFTNARNAQPYNWQSFAIGGAAGVSLNARFSGDKHVRAEVYIDWGNEEENRELFDWLHTNRAKLEEQFGETLSWDWDPMEGKRACLIGVLRPGVITSSDDDLNGIRTWLIDKLLKLKKIFGQAIAEYNQGEATGVVTENTDQAITTAVLDPHEQAP